MTRRLRRIVYHPLSPFTRRAFYAILVLAIVLAIGTVGMMLLEHWDVVSSFYFMALLATAEGPAAIPGTDAGKIFAAVMAFFSIGAAISAITFTFGPFIRDGAKGGNSFCGEGGREIQGETGAQELRSRVWFLTHSPRREYFRSLQQELLSRSVAKQAEKSILIFAGGRSIARARLALHPVRTSGS